MKPVFVIAFNTFREIMRDRILYGLVVFALLMMGFSLILGQLSFTEQARISGNFGLSAIQLSACVLAIFLGSTLVYKEIDKKTILTLLVRPVSRFQFLLGKCLGLIFVIFVLELGLSLVLISLFLYMGVDLSWAFLISLYGTFLEALILLSLALFFSSFAGPFVVVSCCVGVFLVGHWLNDLSFFAEKSDSGSFKAFSSLIGAIIPNLENLNWRHLFTYNESISLGNLVHSSFYAFSWFFIFLIIASIIIERRDFG